MVVISMMKLMRHRPGNRKLIKELKIKKIRRVVPMLRCNRLLKIILVKRRKQKIIKSNCKGGVEVVQEKATQPITSRVQSTIAINVSRMKSN
jgi:hypothetical protein